MLPKRGTIVCSKAGRDCGNFMVVLSSENGVILVADGKQRPLERPKPKNMKHISLTENKLSEEQMLTNRSIRHALNDFRGTHCQGEI